VMQVQGPQPGPAHADRPLLGLWLVLARRRPRPRTRPIGGSAGVTLSY
jgi:hypothetical protein